MQPESSGRQQELNVVERFLVIFISCSIVFNFSLLTETEGARVKQKLVELKSRVNEDDLNTKIDKVHKWLSKGNFVNIVIKVAKNSNKKEAEAVKSKIEAAASSWRAESADLLGTNNAKLIITIK